MTHDVRAQLIFRDASGWSGRENSSSYRDRDTSDAFHYYIGVGLLEAPPGIYRDEAMLDLRVGQDLSMELATAGPSIDEDAQAYQGELSGVAPFLKIKVPFLGALFCSGVAILRETRFPGTEGKTTYAALCLLRSPVPMVPLRTMLTLGGKVGRNLGLLDSVEMPTSFPTGCAISEVYDDSVWGFGAEPRGIGTTLRMDVVDLCEEYKRLGELPERTPEQEERRQFLRRGVAGSVMRIGEDDGLFAEFKRRMKEAGVERPMAWYPTQANRDGVEAEAKRIIEELHEERRNDAPAMR